MNKITINVTTHGLATGGLIGGAMAASSDLVTFLLLGIAFKMVYDYFTAQALKDK